MSAKQAAVMPHEIRNAVAINLNHSQYDTSASLYRPPMPRLTVALSARRRQRQRHHDGGIRERRATPATSRARPLEGPTARREGRATGTAGESRASAQAATGTGAADRFKPCRPERSANSRTKRAACETRA